MFSDGFTERTKDHTVLTQLFFVGCRNRDGIEDGIDCYTRELLLFAQWNTQLLKRLEQLRINFIQTFLELLLLRGAVINNVLVVDWRKGNVRPVARLSHLEPIAISLEPELQHPFRLVLLRH